MKSDDILITVAAVAAVVAIVAAGFTYYSILSFREGLITGYVTQGTANLTVSTAASINFTTDTINWGSGNVDQGEDNATLDTSAGTVTDGDWTPVSSGFVIENIGNVNVTLNLTAGKSAASFIGGTGPAYRWNITNIESGSCTNATDFNVFDDTTTSATEVCSLFQFADSADTVRVDLQLVIPSDSLTGALGDYISAQFEEV